MSREVAVKYGTGGYGKRPDVLQFPGDVLALATAGATSFHISEERWHNPLNLKVGMTKGQLDELRAGWDLLLDIDSNFIEYSKIAGRLLVDALEFHEVRSIGVKFSGRAGLHIMVPFESFPSEVNNQKTKVLFPDGTRAIAKYLKTMIEAPLRDEILSISRIEDITKATGKSVSELTQKNIFDPFKVVDIDPILISSRHLFRSPYSFNEKSGLVSIPLKKDQIKNFKVSQAVHDKVTTDVPFTIDKNQMETEAARLLIQAFDYKQKNKAVEIKKDKPDYTTPEVAIKPNYFPPCITSLLQGVKTDGRKRALFILLNFLHHTGYDKESIRRILHEWNIKNYEQLREGYITGQIEWQGKQKAILPPNCANQSYYTALGVCAPDNLCHKIKNPVQYSTRKIWAEKQHKKKVLKEKKS